MKLFASDIDNTLVPQKEEMDEKSLKILSDKISKRDIKTVYVSGRHFKSIIEKKKSCNLPTPNFILSHVGTSLHKREGKKWVKDRKYSQYISQSWNKKPQPYIKRILKNIKELEEQEPDAQSKFKQSYYLDIKYDKNEVIKKIKAILDEKRLHSKIIYSVDRMKNVGLIDILPLRSGKQGAILYLTSRLNLSLDRVLFSGDSGNDLDALTMGCKAVLVGNARDDVKETLIREAETKKILDNVHISKKEYIEGILEGADYFNFF